MDEVLAPGAVAAVCDLARTAPTVWERRLWKEVFIAVAKILPDKWVRWLDIADVSLRGSGMPERIATVCFGDSTLVYDCTARLLIEDIDSADTALTGAPPGFEMPPGESLSHFIETHGRGVIVLDDLQAFDVRAIEVLADIVDSGLACAEGTASPTLSAQNFIVLTRARLPVPSPRALSLKAGLIGEWRDGEIPMVFVQTLEAHARSLYPEHFRRWVVGRFQGVHAEASWTRACELVGAGQADEPIFAAPSDAPTPPRPQGLPAIACHLVDDIATIPTLTPSAGRYDVFISYSWKKTGDRAEWLRDQLVGRGFRVFFDKDQLDITKIAEHEKKQFFVQKLVWAIESSRACIVFAAHLRSYRPTAGYDVTSAISSGLAMRRMDGLIVEWNWQTLELRSAPTHLVIASEIAYRVADWKYDSGFPKRNVCDDRDLLATVLDYLETQGVRPEDPA